MPAGHVVQGLNKTLFFNMFAGSLKLTKQSATVVGELHLYDESTS